MRNNKINAEEDSNRDSDSGSYELLPVGQSTKLQLSWHDVYYSIKKKGEKLNILKGVSGYANPKEILAIMGSSGSGKTSLLSILSNQFISQSNVEISGRIELNGTDIKSIDYNYYAKYVSQSDILFATLTPREVFMFNASLTTEGSEKEISNKVNLLLEELMLTKVADNLID